MAFKLWDAVSVTDAIYLMQWLTIFLRSVGIQRIADSQEGSQRREILAGCEHLVARTEVIVFDLPVLASFIR